MGWNLVPQRTYPVVTGKGPVLGHNTHTNYVAGHYTYPFTSGLRCARINASWPTAQAAARTDPFVWTTLDGFVTLAANAGYTTLVILATAAPSWETISPPNAQTGTDYAAFCSAIATRYKPGGAFWTANPGVTNPFTTYAIELWNEPYFTTTYAGGTWTNPTAAQYGTLAAPAAAAVKTLAVGWKILVPSQAFDYNTFATSWLGALNTAQAGMLANCDAISVHPYTLPPGNPWGPIAQATNPGPIGSLPAGVNLQGAFAAQLAFISFAAYAAGHPLELWITEYGHPTQAGTDAPVNIRTAKACATTNLTLSGTQTVDGVALIAADICLVTGQTTGSQNGLYAVAAGAWTRDGMLPAAAQAFGKSVTVSAGGTSNSGLWNSLVPAVVGTDPQTWTKVTAASVTEHQAAIQMRQALQVAFTRCASFWWGTGVTHFFLYDTSIALNDVNDEQGYYGILRPDSTITGFAGAVATSLDFKPAWAELTAWV